MSGLIVQRLMTLNDLELSEPMCNHQCGKSNLTGAQWSADG